MVKLKTSSHLLPDGSINIEGWLNDIAQQRSVSEQGLLRHACVLSQLTSEDHAGSNGEPCLRQGLVMADILADLQLDTETLAAAIVYSSVHFADLALDDVREHLGPSVAKLVEGATQLEAIGSLHVKHEYNRSQIENLRKMLLAMVEDVRVVLIKLVERTSIMRSASIFSAAQQRRLARETMDIYAPLANRLGVGQLKWELEDLAFRYLEPKIYKELAKNLDEKRIAREEYVRNFITLIQAALANANITHANVAGRVKHIYSIYRKMIRKDVDYSQIYDVRAIRILVPNIESCYNVLGVIHSEWEHVAAEFDDYIATPKSNGYQSLHTVVLGPQDKPVEVQIRTYKMHQEAELGIAAHWVYKEGKQNKSGYEGKIAWLRQVLDWQKGLNTDDTSAQIHSDIFADRIYVFTPTGDIVDLPKGATPLDFAYHIHSEVGHRCRGAKVNGVIVPLTHRLNTGERVEILTQREANPSRDWMNPQLGYLKSSRARAKIHHWFKEQDYDLNWRQGEEILDRELKRLDSKRIDLERIANELSYKSVKDLLAALGCGNLRYSQISPLIHQQTEKTPEPFEEASVPIAPSTSKSRISGIQIEGVGNLLTHIAGCCQPVPGEAITGFVTHGRGISIHREDCQNLFYLKNTHPERIMEVSWGSKQSQSYPVTVAIIAEDRQGLLRDITTLFSQEKINLIAANTTSDKTSQLAHMRLTIEIPNVEALNRVIQRLQTLPNVLSAQRYGGE